MVPSRFNLCRQQNSPFLPSLNQKQIRYHLSPSKCTLEHYAGSSFMLLVINTIKVKLLICPSLYSVPSTMLHFHFDTHFICLNKCFPILNSKVCIIFSKLKGILVVKFLEKELSLDYSMIVAKSFESSFKCIWRDIKLEILNNRNSRQSMRSIVLGDVKDYLAFMWFNSLDRYSNCILFRKELCFLRSLRVPRGMLVI